MIPNVNLIHYSSKPLLGLKEMCYLQIFNEKPNGLWFSVEGYKDDINWQEWCTSSDFRLKDLKCKHLIKLKPNHNILHLKTTIEILEFSNKFRKEYFKGSLSNIIFYNIDWRLVKSLYDGIIIAPYDWSLKLDLDVFWYYGWDCASGCIWNLEVIESFSLLV